MLQSVQKVTDAGITSLLETSRKGLTNRWLNPVGFVVFDGDGKLEVAHTPTPRMSGNLILSRSRGSVVEAIAVSRGLQLCVRRHRTSYGSFYGD